MKRLLSALLVIAGVFYISMIYRSKSMLYLAVWMLLLLFLLCIYHVFAAGKLRVIIEAPVQFAAKNDRFSLRLRLVNRSLLPMGKIVLQVRARYLLSGVKRKMELQCSVPGRGLGKRQGEVCLNNEWIPEYIGGVYLEVVKAVRYDYFGILGFSLRKKHLEAGERVAVLPTQQEIALSFGDGRAIHYSDKETDVSVFGEKNPPEISDIREYRAGDRIRSIHWKLSAKRDDLMVYEFISEQPPSVVVFLEPLREVYKTDINVVGEKRRIRDRFHIFNRNKINKKRSIKTRIRFSIRRNKAKKSKRNKNKKEVRNLERYITFLYSFSMALLEKGFGHYIAYYDMTRKCATRKTIENEEKLYDFIKEIEDDILQVGVPVERLQEEYREKYQRMAGNTEIVLHKDLSCTYEEEVLTTWEKGGEGA